MKMKKKVPYSKALLYVVFILNTCLPFSASATIMCKRIYRDSDLDYISRLRELKPGDIVSYTILNPRGNDPTWREPEIGIFERLDGDLAYISGRANHIFRNLEGIIERIKIGDLIWYMHSGNGIPQIGVLKEVARNGAYFTVLGTDSGTFPTSNLVSMIKTVKPGQIITGYLKKGKGYFHGVFQGIDSGDQQSIIISGYSVKFADIDADYFTIN